MLQKKENRMSTQTQFVLEQEKEEQRSSNIWTITISGA